VHIAKCLISKNETSGNFSNKTLKYDDGRKVTVYGTPFARESYVAKEVRKKNERTL